MSPLKLVLLSAFLSPYRSGAEAMVEEVAVRLQDSYDITIITARLDRSLPRVGMLPPPPAPPPGPPGADSRERGAAVKIIRVGFGFGFDKWLFPFLAPFAVRKLKPDIIHAVLETFAGLALLLCRSKARKILTLQTTNTSFLKGPILRAPDTVTAISSELVRTSATLGRTDVTLIPNGIDLAAINASCAKNFKDSSRVLFVGRLEPMKGVDTLLKAFAEFVVRFKPAPDVHLRIVGDGSERKKLEKLAKDLDIDHRVKFVGRVSGTAVFDEFAKAEIFCGLSRSEALGNVFLEAKAAGCAVLATNVGGIPDTIKNGETGILVATDDVPAAAEALHHLFSDTALRAKLSVQGKRSVGAYDWGEIAKKYQAIYAGQ